MRFFTADLHLFHDAVIRHCNRPFADASSMNERLVENICTRVGKHDDLYVLGDFSWKNEEGLRILRTLPGRKHLIWGNHDANRLRSYTKENGFSTGWASSQPYLEINEDGQKIVLCHYAMRVWNRSHHGALMLYGHSHGSLPGSSQSLDVGVDCWDYGPVTLAEIRARMETLPPYIYPDHHTPETN